jgi:hypothetical protein
MTSFRRIEANRRNALRGTGPKTEAGKQQSRRNAVRHGLTAETVIGALEDAEDYRDFEAAVIAGYDVRSAVERQLSRFKPSIYVTIGKPVCFRTLEALSIPYSGGRTRLGGSRNPFCITASTT